jgi:hypothetical protein
MQGGCTFITLFDRLELIRIRRLYLVELLLVIIPHCQQRPLLRLQRLLATGGFGLQCLDRVSSLSCVQMMVSQHA